ncbi:hypothetical protein LAZ67_7000699, partial [Cordylochernes scorpioides]
MPKQVSVHRHSSPTYHTKFTHDTSPHHNYANVPHNIHAPIRHHATNTHNPHNKCNTRAKKQQQRQTSACTTVKNNTIIPSTPNIEKIHATKQPHNRKTLRSFLKTVNTYKEFIPDHARLRTPLINLLKKDIMWVWDDECQKAFTNLKESLTTHPTLHLYQEGLPCQVYCNTSTFSITSVLKQVYPDGKTYTIQHFSRSLRNHERNYSDLELQCLAIVESVDNFRTCLMDRKFTIFSDHPALQWLKEIKAPSGRLFRWRLRLSRYEYEVRSINGIQQYETGVVTRIPFCGFLDAPLIKNQQSSPPGKSRVTMDPNKLRTVSRKGVLKTIVPNSFTTRLLKSVHTQHHHPNISKMTRLISAQYYWQNMTQDIAKQLVSFNYFVLLYSILFLKNMTYLARVKKCDLRKLAYELGEVVPPESRIVDLKCLILNSQSYEEEFAKQLLETLIEEREQTERAERERMEQTARTEQAERAERERKEQMEFELEKLRVQTMHGNNDPSRGTSNNAHCEIRKLMPKYESKDSDLSFYLILFERQAKRLGLDEDQWAFSLLGLLPYEMTQLIARETEGQSGDYRFVKRLLLKRYKLSPEQFRQKFEKHDKSQEGSWRDFAFELRGFFNEWIEGMNVEDFDALKDLSVTNQLKKKVPNVLRNHLIDDWTKINNPDVLADKLDEYENVRAEMVPPHWNSKHTIPPSFQQKSARFPNRSEVKETEQGTNVSSREAARNEISEKYPNTSRRTVNRAIRNDKGEPKCFNCNQFGHIARDCPVPKATLTCRGCGQTGHKERNCTRPKEGLKVANLEVEGLKTVPPDVYLKDAKIDNKKTVKAMIDTGSSSCLLRESVARRINVDIEPDSTSLYGIGNQTAPAARTVGKTTVDLEIDGVVGKEIAVFIVNDDAQPYDLLIGRTWTDLPYVSFARIGKELHIGYSTEFPFANLQEEIKSRRVKLRATETVQLGSDCINFASAITDEVRDGYVLFTGVDDCVNSLLEVVDGNTTVPIISVGKGNLRVKKNQCIGRVELLSPDDIVVNLDVSEDSFQTKSEEKREGQDQMKRKRPILPEDVNINHSLTPKERQENLDVVNEYRDCFALGMGELGCTDVTKMDIKEVDGSKPVCLRPYKTTASEREAIREIVREWKDNGIVTETRSPYASPVLLVRKKTGDHRLVVDYRRLNIQTVKDKFPLPRIDDLLEGLRNAKFFTTLDLAHGYLQIPLTDKAKLKTAFITPDDTAQFERMIFGLANAPAEFQRLVHSVLGPLLNKKAFCYLDDVIIPAKDWREMIERLREVLERIRSAKLALKPSKCEFGRREVEFLGYVISTGGLKPDPRKIKEVERDLNNAVNKTTNKTPFETLHGYSPRFHDGILRRLADEDMDPWTEPERIQENVRTQIENKQEIMKTYYDKKKCRTLQFEVEEMVVMRHVPKMTGEPTKAQPKYRGPLIITEVLPSDTYRVTQLSERTGGRFYTTTAHISQLKSWHSEEDDSTTEESPDEESEEEDTLRRNPRRSCNAKFNRGRLESRNGR